ncbi:MAG: hypothetical protein KGM49_03785 [Sphingomonadales bacterium]|nr:hypothetical protein [Sphingomonadales bacterium]
MYAAFSRRAALGTGLSLAALAIAVPVRAMQSLGDLGRLLGGKLPEPLRAALPPELGQAAQIVSGVMRMEEQAKAMHLPTSPLAFGDGALPTDPDRLYESAMPRLVALIDRAATVSPDLADQAGGLLAKLHRTQYDAPDAWFGQSVGAPPGIRTESGSLLHLTGSPVRPLRLADAPGGSQPLGLAKIELSQAALPEPEILAPRPSTSLHFDDIAGEYASWFASARVRPEHQDSATWHLTMMRQSRERYEGVGKRLGVPWYFIAAVHGLEASFNFRAHLHNGDFPLTQRTHQVPAGRPLKWLPPSDWEDSAADALRLMGFAGQTDWSMPRLLYRLEAYNGFGYRRAGRASPYLWSFSTLYDRGKFVADGRFDPNARSQQCGAAVMLRVLADAGDLPA